jgi:hypothetical protein
MDVEIHVTSSRQIYLSKKVGMPYLDMMTSILSKSHGIYKLVVVILTTCCVLQVEGDDFMSS